MRIPYCVRPHVQCSDPRWRGRQRRSSIETDPYRGSPEVGQVKGMEQMAVRKAAV